MKFKGLMDRFLVVKSSGTAQTKVRIAFYLVPTFILTGAAVSKFINLSFGIYLKYQALIDNYYKFKLNKKQEA